MDKLDTVDWLACEGDHPSQQGQAYDILQYVLEGVFTESATVRKKVKVATAMRGTATGKLLMSKVNTGQDGV